MRLWITLLIIAIFSTPDFAQNQQVLQRAADMIRQNNFDAAEKILTPFEKQKNPITLFLLGVLGVEQNQPDKAVDYLEQAVDLAPDSARFHEMLGNAYGLKLRDSNPIQAALLLPKMVSRWEQAIDLQPERISPRISLFMYYLRSPGAAGGDLQLALNQAKAIATIDSLAGVRMLSYFYEESGEFKPAEKWIKRAIFMKPKSEAVLTHAGYFYLRNGLEESGRSFFIRALDLYPQSANAYDSLGDYYYTIGIYDSALVFYDLAIRRNADFEAAWYHKGKTLENLRRRSDALSVYEHLVEQFPSGRFTRRAQERMGRFTK